MNGEIRAGDRSFFVFFFIIAYSIFLGAGGPFLLTRQVEKV